MASSSAGAAEGGLTVVPPSAAGRGTRARGELTATYLLMFFGTGSVVAFGKGYTTGAVLLAEVVITFLLLLVVMATDTDDRAESAAVGLGVGLTIAAGILVTGPISGASLNPARSLGPMLVSGNFPVWLIYVVGPIAGAVLGALVYDYLIRPGEPPEPEGSVEEPKEQPA